MLGKFGNNVTVEEGGTLAGIGTVAAKVTVKEFGTIHAGDTLVDKSKPFYLNGGLTVENGGIVEFPLYRKEVGQMTIRTQLKHKHVIKVIKLFSQAANISCRYRYI